MLQSWERRDSSDMVTVCVVEVAELMTSRTEKQDVIFSSAGLIDKQLITIRSTHQRRKHLRFASVYLSYIHPSFSIYLKMFFFTY